MTAALVGPAAATNVAAAPPVGTTLVMTCDRGVGTAQATIDLYDGFGGTIFDTVVLSCGPDSVSGLRTERVKVTTGNAGFANMSIAMTSTAGSGGCGTGGATPGTFACAVDAGPQVTIKIR